MGRENPFVAGLILFGSAARRESDGRSDLDLLILWEGVDLPLRQRYGMFYKLASRYFKVGKGLTVLDVEYARFINLKRANPLFLNIISDAVVLYDKHGKLDSFISEARRKIAETGLKKVMKGRFYYWVLPRPGAIVEA
ncbi:MAG: nucleotidyltransferase domain-containing protein [Candidatus Bathyarchaeia archaeon]